MHSVECEQKSVRWNDAVAEATSQNETVNEVLAQLELDWAQVG